MSCGIPKDIKVKALKRDTTCVYCHKKFKPKKNSKLRKFRPSVEHIDNNECNVSPENIVMCCGSCNPSKGEKLLRQWFQSEYCKKRGINRHSVADPVRSYIAKHGLN
jgi:5-methylcytosine-specific restriction endonuclease McrA